MTPQKQKARAAIKDVGRCVREQRRAAGVSQAMAAANAGVLQKTICRIERGISNPTIFTLALIADALGCDLADLIPTKSRQPLSA